MRDSLYGSEQLGSFVSVMTRRENNDGRESGVIMITKYALLNKERRDLQHVKGERALSEQEQARLNDLAEYIAHCILTLPHDEFVKMWDFEDEG